MQAFSAILLKSPACPSDIAPAALRAMADAFDAGAARTYEALDGSESYAYLDLRQQPRAPAAFREAVAASAAELLGPGVTAWALTGVADFEGPEHGAPAPFLYSVEIDAARENMPAVSDWYDNEHMLGLSAVPGCVRAQRFLTDGAEQTSCACYEITDKDIRETDAWNAVRGTPWTKRVAPFFLNVKSTMFRAVGVTRF